MAMPALIISLERMAMVCKLFVMVCATISFMAGQGSYGHTLHGFSSDEGERASCPNTNCDGRGPCSSNSQCPSRQCCIDLQLSRACCYTPGNPTRPPGRPPTTTASTTAPATTTTLTSTSTSSSATTQSTTSVAQALPPACGNLPQNTMCNTGDLCQCTTNADCYPNEICCIETRPIIAAQCHEVTPPPTTAGPTTTTTLGPSTRCPSTISNPVCIPGLSTVPGGGTCTGPTDCRPTEVCCMPYRGMQPCCVARTS